MLGANAKRVKAIQDAPLWQMASARMPTRWGMFDAIGFEREVSNGLQRAETALALTMGDLTGEAPLLRIHSQCFTGEVLGSLRCDCSDQLATAMRAIADERRGLVIYEYQEGRGIGLMAKLQAYELQDVGIDTIEANHALGFKADYRDFRLPAAILHDLGIKRVRLLSNNPRKAIALAENGIKVVARLPCEAQPNPHSFSYLRTKKEKMGHALSLSTIQAPSTPGICVRCDLMGWRATCPACTRTATNERSRSSEVRGIELNSETHQKAQERDDG
jgi:3,4-dihydroxy 2-butanone 4-phosphate synthase/GTP cyclohydrolase II